MRQSLMQSFNTVRVIDLHGNSKKKETANDGSKDENVFDIQQGVAIGLLIKCSANLDYAAVHRAELYGLRDSKYRMLTTQNLAGIKWQTLQPQPSFYLFLSQDETLREEYASGWKITDIMPVNSVGIVTARDALTIHWSREDAL